MYSSSVEVTNSPEILTGKVKWFNNKTGFGFISITDGSNVGTDVFVHHSSIKVLSEQYKYLVQGEYVEFTLVETNDDKHKYQAGDVKGIKGGQLMCETRKEFREARNSYREVDIHVNGKNGLDNLETKRHLLQRNVTKSGPIKLFTDDSKDKDWTRVKKKGDDKESNKRVRKPKV